MRFAYVDSQGKEVAIPSVEALQLRIELGAITGETMFYDGNTDKWAPAAEHEIFRTLSRELRDKDEDGFVAPPPPTMVRSSPPGKSDELEPEAEAEPAEPEPAEPDPEPEPPSRKPKDPDPFALEEGPAEAAARGVVEEPSPRPSGESAVEEPSPGPSGEPAAEEPAGDDDSGLGFGEVELGDTTPEQHGDEFGSLADPSAFGDLGSFDLVEPGAKREESGYEGDEGIDFADFGEGEVAEGAEGGAPAGEEMPAAGSEEDERDEEDEAIPSFDVEGGLELEDDDEEEEEEDEEEAAGESPAAPADTSSDLGLERPLSEYSPDRPPSWMDEDEEEPIGGGRLAFEGEDEEEEEEERPRRGAPAGAAAGEGGGRGSGRGERPAPKARPARPAKKESGAGKVVLAIVLLGVLGGAGWFGWGFLQSGEDAEPEETVVIPELAAPLQPTLDAAVPLAYQAMLDSLRALGADLPAAPTEEWLGGRYLANASQFDDVRVYWEGVSDILATAREREAEIFRAELESRLDSLGVTGEDRTALLERADAGFRAARPDRAVVYDEVDTLVRAALGLHDFLVGNEGAIEYSPSASGLSRDPVTEAVPATEALGEEMWGRVREITRALADLGPLGDRVGTERLLGTVADRLTEIPVR